MEKPCLSSLPLVTIREWLDFNMFQSVPPTSILTATVFQMHGNACNFDAIAFVNDFENATFDRSQLALHLDKEVYDGGSLPNLIEGGAPITIGKFNTQTK